MIHRGNLSYSGARLLNPFVGSSSTWECQQQKNIDEAICNLEPPETFQQPEEDGWCLLNKDSSRWQGRWVYLTTITKGPTFHCGWAREVATKHIDWTKEQGYDVESNNLCNVVHTWIGPPEEESKVKTVASWKGICDYWDKHRREMWQLSPEASKEFDVFSNWHMYKVSNSALLLPESEIEEGDTDEATYKDPKRKAATSTNPETKEYLIQRIFHCQH